MRKPRRKTLLEPGVAARFPHRAAPRLRLVETFAKPRQGVRRRIFAHFGKRNHPIPVPAAIRPERGAP